MSCAYELAKKRYEALGIDTEKVINDLRDVNVAMHCWQGDDVKGFDNDGELSGGIQTTGNYPGRARTPDELMADIDKVLELDGGTHKLNLHACYAIFEDGEFCDRDAIEPKHFSKWVSFAKERGMGIDFNPRSSRILRLTDLRSLLPMKRYAPFGCATDRRVCVYQSTSLIKRECLA